ncbi:FAD-dependent oxidoreductase [uncultured Tateyamaria sp.]|uniref:NAD(P)/FAD-dependent oxidoreductase n=1 Tax=uncultured Tateyamaria sp. TaxID=455651 RepID=UPI0026084482|nr:FAD-dependent oxidoreductase [uncultured Tateyamaria sp.]
MRVIIIGGGIIGAALARHLVEGGADVTVLEGGGGATPASFGWVNASYFLNPDHFALRAEGIAAWKRLGGCVTWTGCLAWEDEGADFDAQKQMLEDLGYDVSEVDATQFAQLEPHIAAPERALRYATEGIATPVETTRHLLRDVRRITGVRVLGIAHEAGRVTGVDTAQGVIAADRVVVAAGIGSPGLLASVGVAMPMLKRPGVMVRTTAVAPLFRHILVAPGQELRQDAAGHIWAPGVAQHQSDDAEAPPAQVDALADATLGRVRAVLGDVDLRWDHVMLAERPVPQDGLPVFGPCGPDGLFAAVMHSGVTLAAITAELLGAQVLDQGLSNVQTALAAPFDPGRFQSG